MLTLRATLEPDGRITLPSTVHHEQPVSVLVTFIDEPAMPQTRSSAEATLALLRSPTFQALPKADPQEIEQRIASLRNDWGEE
jgi:hypothetical protein